MYQTSGKAYSLKPKIARHNTHVFKAALVFALSPSSSPNLSSSKNSLYVLEITGPYWEQIPYIAFKSDYFNY